ncbi:cyclic pyranopterin monophosphate synthase MoaC [Megamonas funiformis]|jgi:cyclic pyranopterin phosphate synthase|uniref:cyclic pyranopterin monophosphate synthase MoaC n=1 Tax=Megamonas funiformis TaxID=437897 RepID=UPI0022E40FA8|nr:cyclic pyranopterin monophosphate synthase MoaC [Megamonas funiformis]
MANFTHFNQDGEAIMVDVSQKDITMRIAIAEGSIKVNQEVFRSIKEQTNKKGDVLAVARIAGIMAAKKTSDMIPLCHPLFITKVTIDFELDEENYMIKAIATTKVNGKTGVEMEALHAVSVTLLTIYDMCKAIDKSMEIADIRLLHKEGGKSGVYDYDYEK